MKAELDTVETRYKFYENEQRTILFTPIIVKYMEKNREKTKPRYSKQFLPVPWPFLFSRFSCINTTFSGDKKNSGPATCGHSA